MIENKSSQVEVLPVEPTVRTQFGKGFVYANSKKHSKFLIPGMILFSVMVVPLFFQGTPSKEYIKTIETPNLDQSRSISVNIPFYSAVRAQAEKEASQKKVSQRPIKKYAGIQSIDPDFNIEIPPGTFPRAKIISGSADGPIRAELTEDLADDHRTIFPSGTVFLGLGSTSDNRLQINFSTVILQKKRISIQAFALDPDDKNPGVEGSKIRYYSKKLGVAIGLSFVSGLTDVLQSRSSVGTNVVKNPTIENALLNGVSQTTSDLSKAEMEKVKRGSESVTLSPGTEILISF